MYETDHLNCREKNRKTNMLSVFNNSLNIYRPSIYYAKFVLSKFINDKAKTSYCPVVRLRTWSLDVRHRDILEF